MITVTSLTKTFRSPVSAVTAVKDVSFTLADGTVAAIQGTSGSGKSTLLSLLGGLDRPTSGEIRVGDTVVSAVSDRRLIEYRRSTVGFVFQNFSLIPNLSARENVMLPMEFAKVHHAARLERATHLLDAVGLDAGTQLRRPSRLSGGEQQRVAIARALANRPRLLLADEPTGNLDSKTGRTIVSMLLELPRTEGATVIIVTHDRAVAESAEVRFELEDGELSRASAASRDA